MKICLLEEELNPVNLSKKTTIVLRILNSEIKKLENNDTRDPPSPEGNKRLKVLTEDYQGLVKETRDNLKKLSLELKPIVDKLEESWKYIYSRMRRYDELVVEYNKTHDLKSDWIGGSRFAYQTAI